MVIKGLFHDRPDAEKFRRELMTGDYGPFDSALFVLGMDTTLRITQLLALKICDVTYDDGRIRHDIIVRSRRSAAVKTEVLEWAGAEELERYLGTMPNAGQDDYLFPSVRKQNSPVSANSIYHRFKAIALKLGVLVTGPEAKGKPFRVFLNRCLNADQK
ncbi:MAG: tyrosine-type recombinase/integrase [Deltaproteobacteria bacterium]|nr:tyrosine-type recombinase/integrase [Deltaproteobacteria bacterium]